MLFQPTCFRGYVSFWGSIFPDRFGTKLKHSLQKPRRFLATFLTLCLRVKVMVPKNHARWWFQTFLHVYPYLGDDLMIQFDWYMTDIFEIGWNHQLNQEIFPVLRIYSFLVVPFVDPQWFSSKMVSTRRPITRVLQNTWLFFPPLKPMMVEAFHPPQNGPQVQKLWEMRLDCENLRFLRVVN